MLLFIIIGVVIFIGVILLGAGKLLGDLDTGFWEAGNVVTSIGCFVLIFALLAFLITVPDVITGIQEFKATEQTLEQMREDKHTWEKAAIQIKVVEMNQWLAKVQYWNGTIFSAYIPDEVMELEPIR